MKTIQTILISILLSGLAANAQTQRDAAYEKAMTNTLALLDSARSATQLQQCKNQFERIAQKYSAEWLPLYYTAYCSINSIFFDMKSAQNEALFTEALEHIEKLSDFSQANLSEINTLRAYAYTAMVALNPQTNGQKYFSEIIRLHEQAMKEDPQNPRPIILLANFEQHLPGFIRSGKRNPEEEYAKARTLFEKEQPNIDRPYWGKFFLGSAEKL